MTESPTPDRQPTASAIAGSILLGAGAVLIVAGLVLIGRSGLVGIVLIVAGVFTVAPGAARLRSWAQSRR